MTLRSDARESWSFEACADDVAPSATRGPEVTSEEWELCWVVVGPSIPNDTETARAVGNDALVDRGLELMRGFDVLDRLGVVNCPTLVCVGELDPVTPVEASKEIVDALPAGIGRLEVLEGASHFTWRDVPDRYWPLLADFVTSVGARTPAEARA